MTDEKNIVSIKFMQDLLEKNKDEYERKIYFTRRRLDDYRLDLARIDAKLELLKKNQTDINTFKTALELKEDYDNRAKSF